MITSCSISYFGLEIKPGLIFDGLHYAKYRNSVVLDLGFLNYIYLWCNKT